MNAMMSINCEGDVEAFVRKGIDLMAREEPSTLQLTVPTEWWAQYCIGIFSEEVDKLPELDIAEDEVQVDIIFNIVNGQSDADFTQLSDEEMQDLIDDFLENLDEEDDDDDDA